MKDSRPSRKCLDAIWKSAGLDDWAYGAWSCGSAAVRWARVLVVAPPPSRIPHTAPTYSTHRRGPFKSYARRRTPLRRAYPQHPRQNNKKYNISCRAPPPARARAGGGGAAPPQQAPTGGGLGGEGRALPPQHVWHGGGGFQRWNGGGGVAGRGVHPPRSTFLRGGGPPAVDWGGRRVHPPRGTLLRGGGHPGVDRGGLRGPRGTAHVVPAT